MPSPSLALDLLKLVGPKALLKRRQSLKRSPPKEKGAKGNRKDRKKSKNQREKSVKLQYLVRRLSRALAISLSPYSRYRFVLLSICLPGEACGGAGGGIQPNALKEDAHSPLRLCLLKFIFFNNLIKVKCKRQDLNLHF